MTRAQEIRKRRIELAREAASRWASTAPARSAVQTDIARKGSLGAETPARAQLFQRREALRATVQALEGRRGIGLGQERIIGATFDLRDLPSGEPAQRAGHPVARLLDPPQPGIVPQGFGTGFLVSPRLLLTNHHVFPDKASAQAAAHFGYEHDAQGLHAGTMFLLQPDVFFLTDLNLDFSLVAVSQRSFDSQDLQQFGCTPLIASTGKILMGQPVSIIQYPLGGTKQWAETENKLVFLPDSMPYLQYETDTLPGSSGSPVFNSFWEAIGLHHSGVPRVENGKIKTRTGQDWDEQSMSDDEIDWIANEGVRVSALVEFLRNQKPQSSSERALLDELLASTADPLEKKLVQAGTQGAAIMSTTPLSTGLPSGPAAVNVTVNGTANFNIGTAAPVVPVIPAPVLSAPTSPVAPEKKLRFDPRYADRPGYQANFLGGQPIPLPEVAQNRGEELLTDRDGNLLVLKYHHMSIVMNRERRLMMWAAANIDYSPGKRPISGRDAFGQDQWKSDPRIADELQLEDAEFYAPAKKFDRGHIIRREDNAWGDSPTLQEFGNSDTFHWTNCTPQHEAFNRSNEGGVWGKLENHITEQSADVEGRKLCIFAGPVLAEDDLEHDFGAGVVKVPIRFWKVIAVRQATNAAAAPRLAVFGFVLEQATPIHERGLEAFSVGQFKTFQRPLAEITGMTGVEFPQVLLDADTMSARTGPRPLESLSDLEGLERRPVATERKAMFRAAAAEALPVTGRPPMTPELAQPIVVNATPHPEKFTGPGQQLVELGVIDPTQTSLHKANIQTALSAIGYRITQAQIQSGSGVSVATCRDSVVQHAS